MLSFMRQVQRAALCLPRLCHSARGGTSLRQGPDHPPCLPLAPAQRTPCSRVPSPPSKHTACLSLILLLAPGLCPPRRPLHARGSLDTAHFTLTLASLPLGVVSWGGEDSLADRSWLFSHRGIRSHQKGLAAVRSVSSSPPLDHTQPVLLLYGVDHPCVRLSPALP